MADPTGASVRLGWHLAVKCVAALVPRLRRHHAFGVAPLAPRVGKVSLLAEEHLLAEYHLLAHPLAHASNQILRCLLVFLLDARNKKLRLLLVLFRLLHRRLLLDPTVPPRDANARLREVARARGSQGRQVASNLLQVEHASEILVSHTWPHAPNGLDKGCHSKGAPE